jgi:hypothetical protein
MFYVSEWPRELIICLLYVLKCDIGDVDEAMFHDVERPFERIFYTLGIQKRFGRSRLSDLLSRRIVLRSHNQTSGRLENRICLSRFSNVSSCRKALWTHFLHLGIQKKRLWWSRLSDVLCRRLALRTHILHLDVLKSDFREVDEAMFQGVERQYELIFFILNIEKRDLEEVS